MASERCQGPEKGLIMIERDAALQPVRVEAWVLRHAIATPVRTSFGVMHDRPAVFVRVQDADGWEGWGEVAGFEDEVEVEWGDGEVGDWGWEGGRGGAGAEDEEGGGEFEVVFGFCSCGAIGGSVAVG